MHKEYLILWDEYVIYKDGRIWSKAKENFLKGRILKGYVRVKLKCTDGKQRLFMQHRVIYTYFNGDIPDELQVNHIDENKQNNALSNLNLMTHKENMNWGTCIERATASNRGKKRTEETKAKQRNHPLKSKPVVAVDKDGNVVYRFASTQEADRNGFCQAAVAACCRNCYSTHKGNYYKGYYWYFKEDYLRMKGVA